MIEQRIGFIGAGRMATALARGFLRAELTAADRLLASDPDEQARRRFAETVSERVLKPGGASSKGATAGLSSSVSPGNTLLTAGQASSGTHLQDTCSATTTADNAEVADRSDVIFLAVKPQRMADVTAGLRGKIAGEQLMVSIAAGVRLASLAEWLGQRTRLIRVMPNNPCLIGHGASAYCLGRNARAEDGALVEKLLGAIGSVWRVEEEQMDAVTALSGSGPAFVYQMIEALGEAGAKLGLPEDMAAAMAAQTVRGAAEMVLATCL